MTYIRPANTIPDSSPGGDSVREGVATKNSQAIDDLYTQMNVHSNNEDGRSHVQIDLVLDELDQAQSDIGAARDAALSAQTGAESAQIAAEAARSGAEAAQEGAEVAQGLAESAQAATESMLKDLACPETLLAKSFSRLLYANMEGGEGDWHITHVLTITPDTVAINTRPFGICTKVSNSSISLGTPLASDSRLVESTKGLVFGDSGEMYSVVQVYLNDSEAYRAITALYLHPKHGDVTADFTLSNTYTVIIFREDTDNKYLGDRTHSEYFLGNSLMVPAVIYAAMLEELSNIAPDPTFLNDGTEGGWDGYNGISALPSGGVIDFGASSTIYAGVYFYPSASTDIYEGKQYLVKVVFDSFSTGVVQASLRPTDDAESFENCLSIAGEEGAGTYWAILEADASTTQVKISQQTADCDAVVSEFWVYPIENVPGVVNGGTWLGKNWVSQRLGDITKTYSDGDAIVLALNSKRFSTQSVYVLAANGEFIPFVSGDQSVSLGYKYADSWTEIWLNVEQSWAALGYGSRAEMLNNSVVRVEYTSRARQTRPCENPGNIVCIGDLYTTQSAITNSGSGLSRELIHSVPSGATTAAYFSPVSRYRLLAAGKTFGDDVQHAEISSILTSTDSSSVKILPCLFEDDGNYRVALFFKELVYDEIAASWGDDGKVPIVDYVTTTTDDNGNPVLCGCMSIDTGVAVPSE